MEKWDSWLHLEAPPFFLCSSPLPGPVSSFGSGGAISLEALSEVLLEPVSSSSTPPQIPSALPQAGGTTASGLTIQRLEGEGVTLSSVGSIQNVLRGIACGHCLNTPVYAAEYRAGFELGTVKGPHAGSLGEMMMVGGHAYTMATDTASQDLCSHGPVVHTTTGLFLPKGARPCFTVTTRQVCPGDLPASRDQAPRSPRCPCKCAHNARAKWRVGSGACVHVRAYEHSCDCARVCVCTCECFC